MRMWYGKEREGECDELTLFVLAEAVGANGVKAVRKAANEYGVSRIYLGAGRVDLEYVAPDALELLRVMSASFKIVVETTAACIDVAGKFDGIADEIVLRHDVPSMTLPSKSRLTLKVDNFSEWCAVAGHVIVTDISGLEKGLYPQDKEIEQ